METLITKYVPISNSSNNSKYPPWYTKPLIKLSKEKKKYHHKWKIYGNISDYRTFSLLRKRLRKLEHTQHRNYITLCENRIKDDPSYFWTYVKSKKQLGDTPNIMYNSDNDPLTTGEDICQAFNTYFQTVFIESNSDPALDLFNLPENANSVSLLNSVNIDKETILYELKHINLHKSAGADGIPPIFISKCAKALLTPLYLIFKKSMDTGMFPNKWKQALVTPIPKNNRRELITEYRPISKLNKFGQIFEKIVT